MTELWDVYDEKRNKTGRTHRRGEPLKNGEYHLVVFAWIYNDEGKILIQKRQPWKKGSPDMWDASAAGSAIVGDTSEAAVKRETKEELGIDLNLKEGYVLLTRKFDHAFCDVWLIKQNVDLIDLNLQYEEVADAKWVTKDEIRRMIKSGEFINHSFVDKVLDTINNEPYKNIALAYDEIRPSYPKELIEDIINKTNVNNHHKLLEIGAGTGKATQLFADKGYHIHAIEIGNDMASIFKEKFKHNPNVSLEVTAFENWKSNEKFDLIYSAQAFHWLDSSIKFQKCFEVLKDNGSLVLFWYDASNDPIVEQKIHHVLKEYQLVENDYNVNESQMIEREKEIKNNHLFKLLNKYQYKVETKNDMNQYLKAQNTVPAYKERLKTLEISEINSLNNKIKEIIIENGGYVTTTLNYYLYLCKKNK